MPSQLPSANKNTLLIVGNGLNRAVDNSASWNGLLADLVKRAGYRQQLGKPFEELSPHTNFVTLYQEVALHWLRHFPDDLKLKILIGDLVEKFEKSVLQKYGLHEQLVALPCRHVLTTNYDYVLEECAANDEPFGNSESENAETTFSLYRRTIFTHKHIWHIHGERSEPKSINLGHNQYAGYLQYARQYLIHGIDSSGRERTVPLAKKLSGQGEFENDCWLDLFFGARRIVWLGISLPTAEYVLWWLIFYRAEKAQQFKDFYAGREMHYIDVYDPSLEQKRPDECWQREERNRMLRTAGASIHDRPVRRPGGWAEAYHGVLNELK